MKKLFAILVVVVVCISGRAQTAEYLQQKDFRVEKQKIYDGLGVIKKQLAEMKKGDLKLQHSLDSSQQVNTILGLQLEVMADSLGKTRLELYAMKEKVDNQKFLSRGAKIATFGVLFLLVIAMVIMLYRLMVKSDRTQKSMTAMEKDIREQLALESTHSKEGIQNCKDLVINTSNEMDQRITTGLANMEHNNRQLERHLNESLAAIDGRIELIGPRIDRLHADLSAGLSTADQALIQLKQEMEQKTLDLMLQATKLEEAIKRLR